MRSLRRRLEAAAGRQVTADEVGAAVDNLVTFFALLSGFATPGVARRSGGSRSREGVK